MFSSASSAPSPRRVALRVSVWAGKGIVRPNVGLLVDAELSMHEVLVHALAFKDRFMKTDMEVQKILDMPFEIVMATRDTENTEGAVRVTASTLVGEALQFDPFDHVVFRAVEPEKSVSSSCSDSIESILFSRSFFAGRRT